MSKIVFFCIPAYGHTNPTLPVVRELVQMGNEVYYYSFLEFKDRIEAAGAHFIGCDDVHLGMEDDPKGSEKVGKDIAFSTELIVRSTLALDDRTAEDMRRLKPDVIVGDSVAYWGKLTAMKFGIPFVSSTTTFAFNRYSSKIMKQSFVDLVKMMFRLPKTKKILKPLRDKGYPAENILSVIQNDNDTNTIVYTSREFQPCADTFSDKYSFVGPCIREASGEVEKTGEKLVYISMGTVNNRKADFYQSCIAALAGWDCQVIISVGKETQVSSYGKLPENISLVPFADQIAVLKKADVFLTHCGMNSVNESLYFGVPMILYPQTAEQEGVARRAAEVGAGVYLKKACSPAVAGAVKEILTDGKYRERAQAIAESFRKCGGPKEAARAVLKAIPDLRQGF